MGLHRVGGKPACPHQAPDGSEKLKKQDNHKPEAPSHSLRVSTGIPASWRLSLC